MPALTYPLAAQIVGETLAAGKKRGFKPLTCAVLDAGGHLVALGRDDGSSLLRPQIAVGKAWGVLGMGFGGREVAKRANGAPVFFNALIELSGGNMVPVPGGVLIRDSSSSIVGAVGVSGDTSENDELCAVAAIHIAGLQADTGETK